MEPGTEIRFSVDLLGQSLGEFVKRPIGTPAEEGQIAFLDGLTEKGNPSREVAVFRDGRWGGGKNGTGALRLHQPLTWTVLLPRKVESPADG